ncbi:DUF7155 family protein [Mycobacterium sp. IDR2000157661]|uniref:DUF7155 family protein n=1 Tax=Mycobacterium sp. IDR2000157661 TaxID=2867005 RepID=UPI001EEC9E1B|nr:hypothetical protein [Mycobacterium sp. IDR2000157661]ULE31974.1 hypothetical protein K3G64_17615 [Mycobacterium sp. IDR2000157661]
MHVTSTNNRARRLVAAGAFAVAAVAAPIAASLLGSSDAGQPAAQCLAWFGNKEDNNCMGYSNGNGVNVGTPEFGLYGPDGPGISTGPLFPGRIYGGGTGF